MKNEHFPTLLTLPTLITLPTLFIFSMMLLQSEKELINVFSFSLSELEQVYDRLGGQIQLENVFLRQ